jgi:hypothetical protein
MALYELKVSGGGLAVPMTLRLLNQSDAFEAESELWERGFTVERVPYGCRVEGSAAEAVKSALLMADRGEEVSDD